MKHPESKVTSSQFPSLLSLLCIVVKYAIIVYCVTVLHLFVYELRIITYTVRHALAVLDRILVRALSSHVWFKEKYFAFGLMFVVICIPQHIAKSVSVGNICFNCCWLSRLSLSEAGRVIIDQRLLLFLVQCVSLVLTEGKMNYIGKHLCPRCLRNTNLSPSVFKFEGREIQTYHHV